METLLAKFENHLLTKLPKIKSFHPHFEEALGYMLKASAKRFRPMLLLCVVNSKKSLLVDNANLRRGFQTLHKKYDEVTAILVGDALNTEAFNLIAKASLHNDTKIELVKILATNGGINGMVIGQAIDCHFEKQKLSLKDLEFLHIHKTAKLIAASLKMGALIAGYDDEICENLYKFGIDLGLLFQIQDDIIDEKASVEEALKTTHNDVYKNSFVNLLGLEGAINSADTLAQTCLDSLNSFDKDLKDSLETLLITYINRHKKYKS